MATRVIGKVSLVRKTESGMLLDLVNVEGLDGDAPTSLVVNNIFNWQVEVGNTVLAEIHRSKNQWVIYQAGELR